MANKRSNAGIKWPDLVLLDLHLPKRDGFAVCQQMRRVGALISSTTNTLTGKSWHSQAARRSFQCQRALVEGGSFFLLYLRFWRGLRHGVLRPLRARRMRVLSFSASLTPRLPSAWILR